jgi:hypothetical protein
MDPSQPIKSHAKYEHKVLGKYSLTYFYVLCITFDDMTIHTYIAQGKKPVRANPNTCNILATKETGAGF